MKVLDFLHLFLDLNPKQIEGPECLDIHGHTYINKIWRYEFLCLLI